MRGVCTWNIPATHRELLMTAVKSSNYKRLPKTIAPNFSSYCSAVFVISLHGDAGCRLGCAQYKGASPGQSTCLRPLFIAQKNGWFSYSQGCILSNDTSRPIDPWLYFQAYLSRSYKKQSITYMQYGIKPHLLTPLILSDAYLFALILGSRIQ